MIQELAVLIRTRAMMRFQGGVIFLTLECYIKLVAFTTVAFTLVELTVDALTTMAAFTSVAKEQGPKLFCIPL